MAVYPYIQVFFILSCEVIFAVCYMKQIFLSVFMLASIHTTAQQGHLYSMQSGELSAKTIDGGLNALTCHVLRFDAGTVGLFVYTITTEQKGEQYMTRLTYNDWRYFKWRKKGDRVLITGLPPAYADWATLQIQAHTLASAKNKHVVFEQLAQPTPASAVNGKAYAADTGDNNYLVLTFDTDSVEISHRRNIAPKGSPLLALNGTHEPERYKWTELGKHILIPGNGLCLLADYETQQLQVLYNGKYIFLKQEALYQPPSACITIKQPPAKKRGKQPKNIRIYK